MLTTEELTHFERHGFVGGFSICDPDEIELLRTKIDTVLTVKRTAHPTVHRHLDSRVVYELCSHPAVIERVAAILGPDLLLWHSRFFDKPAGSERIPWHQDCPFWPIEPDDCVSAWIAIDEVDAENACVEVIPGSHKMRLPHIPSTGTGRFGMQADPQFVDETAKTNIELKAGEFFIFDRWLLHGSPANRSKRGRLGLSIRIVPPTVKVHVEKMRPYFPGLGPQIVRGADTVGINHLMPAPSLF